MDLLSYCCSRFYKFQSLSYGLPSVFVPRNKGDFLPRFALASARLGGRLFQALGSPLVRSVCCFCFMKRRYFFTLAAALLLPFFSSILVAQEKAVNPIIWADVPDLAIIRVGDTYYMSSTTMHLSPGVPIMRSKDLVNWEIVSYAYRNLGDNDELNLENGQNAYGKGSWASSIRYHDGIFYVTTFSANTGKTHVFTTKDIERGPWEEASFSPALHDHSLFFDDDGRVFMVHGGGDIRLTELTEDASAIKPGGLDQVIIENASKVASGQTGLPAEGSQIFKINGKYYVFNITWPPGGMRTVIVHRSDSLTGPYEGRVALQDRGIAQGGLISAPDGKWFAYFFQDHGAVGRIPFLAPVAWEDGWPVIGTDGRVPEELDLPASKGLSGIVANDDFSRKAGDRSLPLAWQWNHNPDNEHWSLSARSGWLRLTNGRTSSDVTEARNILTQRTFGPESSAETELDVSGLKDGDTAGLILLQKKYGYVGVKVEGNQKFIVMVSDESDTPSELERVPLTQRTVYLKASCNYRNNADKGHSPTALMGKSGRRSAIRFKWSTLFPTSWDTDLDFSITPVGHREAMRISMTSVSANISTAQTKISRFSPSMISRYLGCLGILLAVSTSLFAGPVPISFDWFEYSGEDPFSQTAAGPGQYHTPILTGFYPDPSICRAGDDYYLVNSTFAYFPGLPIFHSKDLVNWRFVGNAINRPDQLRYQGIDVSGAIFAPSITYHEGTFYIVCTMVGSNGNFVITAKDPAGPWSDPVTLDFPGIDPSLFFDDDGRAWIVNNDGPDGEPLYDGHRAIRIQEFDPVEMKVFGPRKVLVNGGVDISTKPIWIEGPHLYKVNGWYYLSAAEGGTGPGHSQVVFRSKSVEGPYEPWTNNPILTQRDLPSDVPNAVTCAGHAQFTVGPDGKWWAVFLGVRPYNNSFSPMGRETFLLPVDWPADGWPMILPPTVRVPVVQNSPNGVTVQQDPALPLSGSFFWKDDFRSSQLSPAWIMLRTPSESWWKLDAAGHILLTPSSQQLSGSGNPSFLARRVQHPRFVASTSLDVPRESGVSAGLPLFLNEKHYYFLGVRRSATGQEVFLEKANGGAPETVQSAPLENVKKVALRVKSSNEKCSFEYATDSGEWKTLADDQDATIVTSAVGGGFVGATVGMHVRND